MGELVERRQAAAIASGLPEGVPAWYTGPAGAICSISRAAPP
jgi:hypothetical protein